MNLRLLRLLLSSLTVLLVNSPAPRAAESRPLPTDEELRKIASAVPAHATAKPEQPRRLLVFTRCHGYYHVSIPYGARAIELMGEKTGAFKATVSDDIAQFEPAALAQYDGLCLMSCLGEVFLPLDLDKLPADQQTAARQNDERLKRNLLEYVRQGHGIAGVHGGIYLLHDWPPFAEVMGAAFVKHPWNSYERIAVKLDEPEHPLNVAFGGRGFDIIDEGYMFKDPYSRARNRVLYSMDLTRMDTKRPDLRSDGDFGLCWVKRYGEGRIFYTALGHNSEEFWQAALLQHILDGLQFSLGDLKAPSEPRGK